MAPTVLAIVACGSWRRICQRGDSGSRGTSATASINGKTPPSTRMPCQPISGTSCALTTPPKAEPRVNPQNIRVTSAPRRRAGKYSEVMVMVLGIAPPRPRPVRKRRNTSICRSGANAESRLNRPNRATQNSITRLRPKRSESGPQSSAPAVRPSNPAPNNGARSPAVSCQWLRISGAIKPIAAVSKPSSITTRKQQIITRHCRAPTGAALSSFCNSSR